MLHTPDEFLNAIEAHPADRTRRLIFADWLDEYGDPRGELIRIEEEMRELPVFTDRFWELKPRRNELRAQAGTEWCGRMRYGTECEPVFRHGIPDGWRERWRLSREFTERWHRIPMGDVCGRQAEIAEAEQRLGRKLPPSVRERHAYALDARAVDQGWPLAMSHLEAVPERPAIALRVRRDRFGGDEFYWYHAVRWVDLNKPDPPLYTYTNTHDAEDSLAESVSAETLQYVLAVTAGSGGEFDQTIEGDSVPALRTQLSREVGAATEFVEEDYYEADGIFVSLSPYDNAKMILRVKVAQSLPPNKIPDAIWEQSRRSESGLGVFAK